jgi:hypothetical protein
MSIKRRLACTVITFSFVMISWIPARSDEGRDRGVHAHAKRAAAESAIPRLSHMDIASQLATLPRSAPIGHRQPRAVDLHIDAELSPDVARMQRENDAVDRKLAICRGC